MNAPVSLALAEEHAWMVSICLHAAVMLGIQVYFVKPVSTLHYSRFTRGDQEPLGVFLCLLVGGISRYIKRLQIHVSIAGIIYAIHQKTQLAATPLDE